MDKFFQEIAASFQRTFINDDRWLQFLKGLGVTIEITVVAAVIGIILGFFNRYGSFDLRQEPYR